MNILIVYAHQEPQSFNAAMKETAVNVLSAAGHQVLISDLYAMQFKAVADHADFAQLGNPHYFKYQIEQNIAYDHGTLAEDIRIEQEKLLWANRVIFQFPLWWFSVPAILKGWFDRVLCMGFAYGGQHKFYDHGGLVGRKAMLAFTTGGPDTMYSSMGMNGEIEKILYPIQHGVLYFTGMQVLPPFIAWAAARVSVEQREHYLLQYTQCLQNLEDTLPIDYQPLAAYDETFQLKDTHLP